MLKFSYQLDLHINFLLAKLSTDRQATLWLHDIYLEVLTVHSNELRLLIVQGIPPSYSFDIGAVGTIFNVSSMTACGEDLNPTPPRHSKQARYQLWPLFMKIIMFFFENIFMAKKTHFVIDCCLIN